MKKLAIFRSDLLPYSETFVRDQARALRKWHPVLIGNRWVPNGLSLDGLEVRLLPNPGLGTLSRLGCSLRYWLASPDRRTVTALRGMGFSLIHAHFGTFAVDFWPVTKALGLPMLVTLHGYDINIYREWWEAGQDGLRRRLYPRRLLAMARHPRVRFIAVSQAIRERAIEFGIPEDKIAVHYIGVDTSRFQPGGLPIYQRSKRVLFVGRLIENKGVAYLIRAYAALRERIPEAELVVAGDGPLRPQLERLAIEQRAPAQFLGAISSDEVKHQMDQARVLCLPSVTVSNGASEGFGLVLLEAQACGLPVITSARGGKTEGLQNSITGFSFAEGDTAALIAQLTLLLGNDESLKRMSSAAIEFVRRNFDIRERTVRLEMLYDSFTQ